MGIRRRVASWVKGWGSAWERHLMNAQDALDDGTAGSRYAFTSDADYLQAMSKSAWVNAAVSCIADNFTRPRWWFERAVGRRRQEEVEIPDLQRLLRNPTPYHTGADLFAATQMHLDLCGKAFWYLSEMTALSMMETAKDEAGRTIVKLDEFGKPRLKRPDRPIAGGRPGEIWLLQPDRVQVVSGEKGVLYDHFVYEPAPGKRYTIPADAIVYFRRVDPSSMIEGLGVIEALRLTLETDFRAAEWNRTFFLNGARPDMIVGTDQEMSDEQLRRFAEGWKQKFGGQRNAHRVAFLSGGLKPLPYSNSHKDMDFLAQRNFTREEILALFRVPPAKVGILTHANYANVDAQERFFWTDCMEPRLRRFAATVTQGLVSRYDPDAELVFEDMTPADLNLQSQIAQRFISAGVWNPNQARAELGLGEPYAGGDRFFVAAGLTPIGRDDSAAGLGEPDLPENEPEPEPEAPAAGGEAAEGEQAGESGERATAGRQGRKADRRRVYHKALSAEEHEAIERGFRKVCLKEFQQEERDVLRALMDNEELRELAGGKVAVVGGGLELRFREKGELSAAEEQQLARIVGQLTDWREVDERFGAAAERQYTEALKRVGQSALADVGVELAFDVANPLVRHFLETYIPKLAGSVSVATRTGIAEALAAGLREGESIPKLRDRVRDVFKEAKASRAACIARSEECRAATKGEIEGWRQSRIVEGKEWIIQGDACEWCVEMEGRTTDLDGLYFEVGESFTNSNGGVMVLDYTEIDGPPLHPNCRCALVPILREAE